MDEVYLYIWGAVTALTRKHLHGQRGQVHLMPTFIVSQLYSASCRP
jgi:hypothetical protein